MIPSAARALMLASLLLTLSSCSSNRYCLKPQEYQRAGSVSPLVPVEGLTLPESAAALSVPPPPKTAVPFGRLDGNGNGLCLDRPPEMAEPPAEPAAG
ncbi:MAG TPA: hypothetical protein VFV27_10890 [Nevskiaceae bacterium]|nr:hypothetical protein [Nevskiaceae bacterium]